MEKAYQQLVVINGLAGTLPGTASTAVPVEDVGMFSLNVVQSEIVLGVVGAIDVVKVYTVGSV